MNQYAHPPKWRIHLVGGQTVIVETMDSLDLTYEKALASHQPTMRVKRQLFNVDHISSVEPVEV